MPSSVSVPESDAETRRKDLAYHFLSRGFLLKVQLDNHLDRLRAMNENASRITSVMNGMPRSGSLPHGLEDMIARIVDYEASLVDEILDFLDALDEIRKVIFQVPDQKHRLVLELRYLSFYSWNQIAAKLYYTRRTMMNYHRDALLEVAEILGLSQNDQQRS